MNASRLRSERRPARVSLRIWSLSMLSWSAPIRTLARLTCSSFREISVASRFISRSIWCRRAARSRIFALVSRSSCRARWYASSSEVCARAGTANSNVATHATAAAERRRAMADVIARERYTSAPTETEPSVHSPPHEARPATRPLGLPQRAGDVHRRGRGDRRHHALGAARRRRRDRERQPAGGRYGVPYGDREARTPDLHRPGEPLVRSLFRVIPGRRWADVRR